jgi:O-antigen/teichoic acid export membrane protein
MTDRPRRTITVTTLARSSGLAITGISYLLISRILGPAGFGEFTVLVTIATVATQLGHLSLQYAQTYLWGTSSNRGTLVGTAEVLSLVSGTLSGASAWVVVYLAGGRLVPVPGLWVLAMAVATVPFAVVVTNLSNLVILGDQINRFNVAYALGAGCQLVAVSALALSGHLSVQSALATWVGSEIVPALVLLHAFPLPHLNFSMTLAKRTLSIALRYHLGVVFLFMLLRADILILNGMVGAVQVGRYSLAVAVAELTYLTADAIAQVMLPRQTDSSIEVSAQLTARLVRASAVVGLVSSAGILLASELIVPLVFGQKYNGVLEPLGVLMPGIVALATVRAASGFLIRLNQPVIFSITASGCMVLNVALNFALIPQLGIVGSALASTVAYVALAACYVTWISRAASIGLSEFIPRLADLALIRGGRRPAAGNRERDGESDV